MRTRIPLLVLALALLHTFAQADVTLIENGKARAAVYVVPRVMETDIKVAGKPNSPAVQAEANRRRLRESVRDLSHYLEKITGAPVEIVTGPPTNSDKRVPIFIGELGEKAFGPTGKTAAHQQAFRYVVSPKGVAMYGESDLAASYAIFELLDRLGCRWYMPSDLGEVIPEMKSITLEETDFASAPATIYRGVWFGGDAYDRHNRLGGYPIQAQHALEKYITPEQREQHPEWMADIDGVKHPRRLKWSAPGLAQAIAASIDASLKTNPRTSVALSPGDGSNFDTSEADRKLDAGDFDPLLNSPSITDRLLVLCNAVAEEVLKKYPDVTFGLLAYAQYTRPPVREKLNPHIVPMIAPITFDRAHPITDEKGPGNKDLLKIIEGWAKVAPEISYYPYAWFLADPAAPYPLIKKWSIDLPLFYKNNCVYWQPETKASFETSLQGIHLGNRLAWNPNQNPADIIAEIHRNFYGNAAKEMTAYWTFIDDTWVDLPEYTGGTFGHLQRFTPEVMAKARALMNAGLAACKTITEYRRVEMANQSLTQFERFMKMRRDFAEGRFSRLYADSELWRFTNDALAEEYKDQYAFGRLSGKEMRSYATLVFDMYHFNSYADANRIARDYDILTKPLKFKFHADKEQKGEASGWRAVDFDDSSWKETTPVVENWSNIGFYDLFGDAWYRTSFDLPAIPKGPKVYLWIGSTDGSAEVFINGKTIPYIDPKTGQPGIFTGHCVPVSFDITDAIKAGGKNHVAIRCNRPKLNSLGTGGITGPVVVYRQKNSAVPIVVPPPPEGDPL